MTQTGRTMIGLVDASDCNTLVHLFNSIFPRPTDLELKIGKHFIGIGLATHQCHKNGEVDNRRRVTLRRNLIVYEPIDHLLARLHL